MKRTTVFLVDDHAISLPMVKEHVNALRAKLNVANRTEAVALALRKQLLKI